MTRSEFLQLLPVVLPAVATVVAPAVTWILDWLGQRRGVRRLAYFQARVALYEKLNSLSTQRPPAEELATARDREVQSILEYLHQTSPWHEPSESEQAPTSSGLRYNLLLYLPRRRNLVVLHILFYLFIVGAIWGLLVLGDTERYLVPGLYLLIAVGVQRLATRDFTRPKQGAWMAFEIFTLATLVMLVTNTIWVSLGLRQTYVAASGSLLVAIYIVANLDKDFRVKLGILPIASTAIFGIAYFLNALLGMFGRVG